MYVKVTYLQLEIGNRMTTGKQRVNKDTTRHMKKCPEVRMYTFSKRSHVYIFTLMT